VKGAGARRADLYCSGTGVGDVNHGGNRGEDKATALDYWKVMVEKAATDEWTTTARGARRLGRRSAGRPICAVRSPGQGGWMPTIVLMGCVYRKGWRKVFYFIYYYYILYIHIYIFS
jgi:hypothetical protein